jgi:hypothetical protein
LSKPTKLQCVFSFSFSVTIACRTTQKERER